MLSEIPLLILLTAAGWLSAGLIRARLWRRVPLFTIYVLYSLITITLRMATLANSGLYFKVYWITEAGDACLSLAALYESFVAAFKGLFLLKRFKLLLPAVAAAVIAYSAWRAVAIPPVQGAPLLGLIVALQSAAQYLIAVTFMIFVVLERALKPSHVRFPYLVVCGFGLASCGALLATLLRSEFGTRFKFLITWSATVGYLLALVVWLAALYMPEDVRETTELSPETALQELRLYDAALRKKG